MGYYEVLTSFASRTHDTQRNHAADASSWSHVGFESAYHHGQR